MIFDKSKDYNSDLLNTVKFFRGNAGRCNINI